MSKPITVIEPSNKIKTRPEQVWKNRELIMLLVKRAFTVKYKQTVLGMLWAFINPFVTTVVFNLVFGRIAKLSPSGVPSFLFFMSGNLVWGYFASCFSSNSNVFYSNVGLFGKVYFPRIIIPVVNCINSLINFAVQFVFFLGFCLYFYIRYGGDCGVLLNPTVLLIPLLLLQMALLGVGLGAVASSVTVKYRDLSMVFGFGVTLWMYLSPVVYDYTVRIPEGLRTLYRLNPMVCVIDTFRCGFLDVGSFSPLYLLGGFAVSVLVFVLGISVFDRVQRDFIDKV